MSTTVHSNLTIGSFEDALNAPTWIGALLCVAEERHIEYPDRLYHKIPIIDMQPIPVEQICRCIEWIDSHIGRYHIMVFCSAGVGRSPSIVISYLCCRCGFGFGEAVEYIAGHRPYMSILPMLMPNINQAAEQLQKQSMQ